MQRQGEEALNWYQQTLHQGSFPNHITFISVIQACCRIGDVEKGKQIHNRILHVGFLRKHVVLGNVLLDMYVRFGVLSRARRVFEGLPVRNVISWSALIGGFIQHKQYHEAFHCFEQMQTECVSPNAITFTYILKSCGLTRAITKGKQLHDDIISQGLLKKDIVLGNALIDMYGRCGMSKKAQEVMEELPVREVDTWSAVIAGYAQQEEYQEALSCFKKMRDEGISPNASIFICILKLSGATGDIDKGRQIHNEVASRGLLEKNIVLGNALVYMYAKCGMLAKAKQVLIELPARNIVTWSSLIAGYAQQGQGHEALECFTRMQREGISPNEVTLVCILKACGSIRAFDKGTQIHDEIAK